MAEPATVATGEDVANLAPGAAVPDPGATFAEQSQLSYMVPATTDLNLEEAFKDVEPGQSIIDSIKQRDTLFFGEFRSNP